MSIQTPILRLVVILLTACVVYNYWVLNYVGTPDSSKSPPCLLPAETNNNNSGGGGTKTQHPTSSSIKREMLLYSKHSHIPSSMLDDGGLAPLTKWTQHQIFQRFHPANCTKAKFLVTQGWPAGLGSELHVIGSHMAHALQNDLVLVWGPTSCESFVSKNSGCVGCGCLFLKTTHCPENIIKANTVGTINGAEYHNVVPDIFQHALKQAIPSMTAAEIRFWWRGQSVGYLARFNEATLTIVSQMRTSTELHRYSSPYPLPYPLPAGTINAHIRHGDKYMEMPIIPAHKYWEAALALVHRQPLSFGNRTYFVSSDSDAAIDTSRAMAETACWNVVHSNMPRATDGFVLLDWINMDQRGSIIHSHLLQLLMSLESDAWIGTRASNWNRLIDELRCVWIDKCKNIYIEVGVIAEQNYDW